MGRVIVRESPLNPGQAAIIRTVTHTWVGRVLRVSRDEVLLGDASWVADAGRWSEFTAGAIGASAEIEAAPGVVSVMRSAIVDVCAWPGNLPLETR